MSDATRGFLLIVLASVCLATLPTAVKLGLDVADPVQLLAPRMALGAALIALWIGLTRPQRFRIDHNGLRACVLAGVLNVVSLLLFYEALRRVDAAIAMLVFSVYPAILLLMLHLRGERVTRLDAVRLALALAGVALITQPGGGADALGVALAVGCAGVYALYMLLIQTRLTALPASTSTVWIVTTMAVVLLVLRLFVRPAVPLDAYGWMVVVWSAVLGTGVARMATVAAVRLIGSGQTALLLPVETVLSVGVAMLVLGERLSLPQATGAALVLTSVGLAIRGQHRLRAARLRQE